MFTIEKNHPIPKGRAKYPLDQLEVGDSFFIPEVDKERHKNIRIYVSGWARRSKTGMKFTTRAVDDGIRVWRTE